MEDVPAARVLVHRVLQRPPRALRPPVDRLEVDVHADLAELLGGDDRLGVGDVGVGGVEDDHPLALVAAFLQQLLRPGDVLLLGVGRPRPDAGGGPEGRVAHEDGPAGLLVLGVADDGGQVVLLVPHRVEEGLAVLHVVERRGQVVRPHDGLRPDPVDDLDRDVPCLLHEGQVVGRRDLDDVHLALDQRLGGGVGVRNHDPLDPVDLRQLGAREAVRRVGPRLVERVLLVDDLAPRDPLLLHHHERAGPDRLGDLLVGRRPGFLLPVDEERVLGRPEHLED